VPSASAQVDYEGELGVVIGRRCRNVPVARALEVVAGYTVVNDVSVRDWQRAAGSCPGIGTGPLIQIGTAHETASEMVRAHPTFYDSDGS